jgi:hypothetical protein
MNDKIWDCRDIKEQFGLRTESFDNSARWIKDRGLLDIHEKLAENGSDTRLCTRLKLIMTIFLTQ